MTTTLSPKGILYREQGGPEGPHLVFIHGFPFTHETWMPQLSVLPEDLHAVAYDIRGMGGSDPGDGQYTIDLFVDDLIELLDHLRIDRAILCGLSLGGYIAQRAVQRHADRIRGLILCCTKSEADTDLAKLNRAGSIRDIKRYGPGTFIETFQRQIFCRETFEKKPDIVAFIVTMMESVSPFGFSGCQLALASRTDTTSVLSSIVVPALVMAGEHDPFAPPAVMKALAEKIPGAEFCVLPHAAHMINLESTEEFNVRLLDFLQKICRQ